MNRLKIYAEKPTINDLSEPGFFTPNIKPIKDMIETLKLENLITPPRGNLFQKNVIVGYEPGTQGNKERKKEIIWQTGRTSKFLLECLKELNTFPYFTNLYKTPEIRDNDMEFLAKELEFISKIIEPNIIFLGKYKDYHDFMSFVDYKYKFNIIYHPSWALRFNKKDIFKEQLKQYLK